MPEGQPYNWGNALGTIATMATGNPYIGMAVNHGFNWTRQDKGNNDNSSSYNTGKLANNVVTALAARKSAKKRAQATQNAGKLDLGYLRTEAERNGFNPLTVLRATGGQGSRKSSDAGKLASAQFWQTFAQGMPDTYNNSVSVGTTGSRLIDPMLSKSIAVSDPHVTQSKIMYQPSILKEETVTSLLSNGMQITTDDRVKSIVGMTRDRHGDIHYHPWIEWELDEMATQFAGNMWFEATHWRDKALKAIGKFFTAKKTDKISKQQIRDIVNSRKITKSYLHTPKLQSDWSGYKYTKALQ